MSADPDELHDLSGADMHRDRQAELRSRLKEWLAEQSDPLLSNPN
jgi:hypothetical protein